MRRTRHMAHDGRGTLPRRTVLAPVVLLGAVLYGCAFFVPAVGTAAGITVEIIKPDKNPIVFDAGKEHEFEAVAFVEGQELPGGSATWDWSFGDETDHSAGNPALHTYASRGSFHVVVTATYVALSGQAELNVQAGAPGTEDLMGAVQLEVRYGGWTGHKMSGDVCDHVSVVLRIPHAALIKASAVLGGARFAREVPSDNVTAEMGDGTHDTETVGDEVWEVLHYDQWMTTDRANGVASLWKAWLSLEVPPPAGQEGPWVETYGPFCLSCSPQNLVITAGGPLVIEHKKGDQKHTLTWNSQHLEDAAAGVPTTYTAVVQVLEMSGAVAVTSPPITCTINQQGSWEWHPKFSPGLDANWLYAFRITGEHAPEDSDADKVDMLAITDSHSRLVWPQHMPPVVRIDVDFTLSQASDTVEYDVYDSELSEVVKSGGLGSFGTGNHTARVEFPVTFPSPGLGRYTLVLKTKQADGSGNRDGRSKPAVPKAWSVSFGLSAKYVYIYSTGSSGFPGPGHAAAGESWSKGWPYTRVFGWYAPADWDFDLYGATLGLLKCRTTSGEDPLTTTVEHDGLAHAFEVSPDGGVATRVATYIAQTPTAQEKWEQFLYSGGAVDFDGDDGETCKNYDLTQQNGKNCVGFVAEVAALSFTGLSPWDLADDLQSCHDSGTLSYVTGWWKDGGLAAHDCDACRQARGVE